MQPLRRYQDVIDGYLNNGAMNVINMLNAKCHRQQ